MLKPSVSAHDQIALLAQWGPNIETRRGCSEAGGIHGAGFLTYSGATLPSAIMHPVSAVCRDTAMQSKRWPFTWRVQESLLQLCVLHELRTLGAACLGSATHANPVAVAIESRCWGGPRGLHGVSGVCG